MATAATPPSKKRWWRDTLTLIGRYGKVRRQLFRAMLSPPYQTDSQEAHDAAWEEAAQKEGQITLAREGMAKRLQDRGHSYQGSLVFIALLGGGLIAFGLGMLGFRSNSVLFSMAALAALVGFGFISWGAQPSIGKLVPKHIEDEYSDGLRREPKDWYGEAAARSTDMRASLQRARVGLATGIEMMFYSIGLAGTQVVIWVVIDLVRYGVVVVTALIDFGGWVTSLF